jgi:hypothetical protein
MSGRIWISFLILIGACCPAQTQELPIAVEQDFETLAAMEESVVDDDSYMVRMEGYQKHPLNLNTAERIELLEFGLLSDLQIENLISYLRLLGNLEHIYELQAIPTWDINTIRKILPYVSVSIPFSIMETFKERFVKGEHSVLSKVSQSLAKTDTQRGNDYDGSPQRIFMRFRYNYKNLLQFGLAGDKDAGEAFFSGAQKTGFDFCTFHLFARRLASVSALAIGDFTVNIGQGLIHWQSLSFSKSAGVMNIKRQSPVLRPYTSAGEFNFHRGLGITISRQNFEFTTFSSLRNLSAKIEVDSINNRSVFSSIQTSGYHRTESELLYKNKLTQVTVGGSLKIHAKRLIIGINGVWYRYSSVLDKGDEPYQLFAIKGRYWNNASIDYSYTYKNLHWFGEFAVDRKMSRAALNGLMISLDTKVDFALIHRGLEKEYQSIYGNAFTENTLPSNENGIYAGIAFRPQINLRLEGFVDVYQFPWLKYNVDAPSSGRDYLLQLTYTPDRKSEVYFRWRRDLSGDEKEKTNGRLHVNFKFTAALTFRNRLEWVTVKMSQAPAIEVAESETGFLTYTDILYKPPMKPYSLSMRWQYFETDGYDSRLYAYENDVLFGNSIPAFAGKGYRCYVLFSYAFGKKWSAWCRWARTSIVNSPEQTTNEWKIQVRWVPR